jgi:hypothetical protein
MSIVSSSAASAGTAAARTTQAKIVRMPVYYMAHGGPVPGN